MDSRSTINPSSWRTPLPDLQAQYRQIVGREAPNAVEERDPVLWREIEALRFKCRSLDSELCDVNRCLEVESAMVKHMQENERWLRQSIWDLEEERKVLNLIIDNMKKEIGEFKSKKSEEIDRVSELLRMNKDLQTQKSELEVRVRTLENTKKANEVRRVKQKKLAMVEAQKMEKDLQTQKSELEVRVRKLENAKKANEVRSVKQKKLAMVEAQKTEKDLQTQMSELEVRVRKLENARKANEVRRVKQKKLAMVEAQKTELSLRIQVLEKEKKSETERIMNEKTKLEIENRRLGEEVKKMTPQLAHTIQVLKKEKIEKRAAIERKFRAKTELAVVAMVEAQKRLATMETEKTELSAMIEALEKEKSSILNEKMARETENTRLEERISELFHKNDVLEKEKGAIEADFREMNDQKSTELERMLNETIALEDQIRVLETEKSEKNSEIEKIMKEKTDLDMEKRRAEKCSKEENSELIHKIEVLERSNRALEAEVSKMEKEKNWMRKRMDNVKTAFETEKRRLEEDTNEKISELVKRAELLEKDKNVASVRIVELTNALEVQKSLSENQVSEYLKLIGVLEREKEALEAKVSEVYMEVSKGILRIAVLEKERKEFDAKLCQENNDKPEYIQKILNEKKALEARKRDVEDECKKMVSELVARIRLLKKEKKKLEAKISQANEEKNEVIERILKEKAALEEEKRALKDKGMKKVSGLIEWIEELEEEKKEMEAKVLQAKKEMKVAKEDYQKKILELDRNDILERENSCLAGMKRKLQTEINLPESMLMEDTQPFQRVCLSNDAVILSTPRQNEGQNSVGMALSRECFRRDDQYKDWMASIKPCKRKRSIRKWEEPGKKLLKTACEHLSSTHQNSTDLGDVKPLLVPCEKNTEINTTRCTVGSEGKVDCKWEVEQDVLDAFDIHPELCLRALCALYRQKNRLGDSTNISLSSEGSGLAEFLIKQDPEGRQMKKMVAKLDNKIDRDAVGLCRKIAKQHHKQVLEMYKKKEDPVFLP